MGQFIVVLQDLDNMNYKLDVEADNAAQAVVTAIQKVWSIDNEGICTDFGNYEVVAVYPEFSDLTHSLDEDVFAILEVDDFEG